MFRSRSNRRHCAGSVLTSLTIAFSAGLAATATGQEVDWIANSGNFCVAGNWNPGIVPDIPHHAFFGRIGSTSPTVWMDCNKIIKALTIQGGTKFHTNGRQLIMLESAVLDEQFGQTHFYVTPLANPSTPAFFARDLLIKDGATFQVQGSAARIEESVSLQSGGNLFGHGVIELLDTSNNIAFSNRGTIRPSGGDLTIKLSGNARFYNEVPGRIQVTNPNTNLLLDVKMVQHPAYRGLLEISSGNSVTFTDDLKVDGELLMRGMGSPSHLHVGELSLSNGGRMNMNGGSAFVHSPKITFYYQSSMTVPAGSTLTLESPHIQHQGSSYWYVDGTLIVNGLTRNQDGRINGTGTVHQNVGLVVWQDITFNLQGGIYDMDGQFEQGLLELWPGRRLTINAAAIESDGTNTFDGTILHQGKLIVNTATPWRMNGVLVFDTEHEKTIGGSPLILGPNAEVDVRETTAIIEVPLEVEAGAKIDLSGPDTKLYVTEASAWHGGEVVGENEFFLQGDVLITGDATVATDIFHWGDFGVNTTILPDATFSVVPNRFPPAQFPALPRYSGIVTVQGNLHVDLAQAATWNCDGTIHLTGGTVTGDNLRMLDGGRIFVHPNFASSEVDVPLRLDQGSRMTINAGATVRLNGDGTFRSGSLSSPALTGPGTFVHNGDLQIDEHTLIDVAHFDWDGDANNATTRVVTGKELRIASQKINVTDNIYHGTAVLSHNASLNVLTSDPWQLAGVVRSFNESPQTLAYVDGADVLVTGRVTGNVGFRSNITNAGILSPGSDQAFGRLILEDSNWIQTPEGSVEIKIGGYQPGISHDVVSSSDTASSVNVHLAGQLRVSRKDFQPSVGDEFVIIAAQSISGSFDSVIAPGFEVRYESQGAPGLDLVKVRFVGQPSCPADIAPAGGDGSVDISDLLALLASWGPCDNCPADIAPSGGDGQVDISDLLALLAAWGNCGQ